MDNIVEYVAQVFFDRKCLEQLIEKATTPFRYEKDGYTTITNGKDNAMCASIMALEAVDGVLTDKRKDDELSRIATKMRKTRDRSRAEHPT